MKKTVIYIVFVALLFLLLYWMNSDAPIQYRWTPTFSDRDKQPYGAYAFDKIMQSSWKKGYIHSFSSISDWVDKGTIDDYNLLIIADEFTIYEDERDQLLEYVRRGGNAFIVANYFAKELEDTLDFFTLNRVFSYQYFIDLEKQSRLSVRLYAAGSEEKAYSFPATLCDSYFGATDYEDRNNNDSVYIISECDSYFGATDYENRNNNDSVYIISETATTGVISMRYSIGKGNLILACNPLAYTNYGILNDSISEYVGKHLAYLQDRPLIRTEYYQLGSQAHNNQSPFRYILSERPLRWAFYLTLACILIFMIFTAKRKQKVIPIIQPPPNKMLAFVRSIAGLYILKNNNADIVSKKYVYWAEDLKKRYGIDLINENHDWHFYVRFASKTGQPVDEIRRLLIQLRAVNENASISDEEMMLLIIKMNQI